MDSQLAKEKALEDLRKIKEELLQRDKNSNKTQANKPITKLKSFHKKEKHKKKHKEKHSHKKHKKSDKKKDKHKSSRSSSRKRHSSSSSSSSSSESDSSPDKKTAPPKKRSCSPELEREEWMTSSVMIKTFSKDKPLQKKQCQEYEVYEPGKSVRELNPHWKNGGTGLPSFRKPREDSDDDDGGGRDYSKSMKHSSSGYKKGSWVKKAEETKSTTDKKYQDEPASTSGQQRDKQESSEFLTDQQMNELGAKIMKAEIMNDQQLADELKNKLKSARLAREQNNGKESLKPRNTSQRKPNTDRHRPSRSTLLDDDEHDLKKKFQRETTTKNTNEDVDEEDSERPDKRHNNCDKCLNSHKMKKEFIVSMGKHVYLALPWHEGLQVNHCFIIPIDHYSCSTALDEDVWQEISSYRRVLTKVFAKRKQDVLFFETARYLQKRRHMVIHCIPSAEFEMAPFYFKKAIEESEYEWSKNKQLVTLKDKNLRKSIPCGLPYFWVHFGMDYGFAHVIENQEMFPLNFAQEIIGGMLTLDMRKWRTPREEHNFKTKVKNLADLLKPYESELC